MPIFLRHATASQEIPLGYFVDSTDGDTEETGLTVANTDLKIWKTGATTLANKNSGGGTHISNGIYYAVLDATDSDTIGPLVIFCHVSGALPIRVECVVLDENVYDALFGTTALATGAIPTTAAIADAVLDEAAAGHTGLIATALPNAVPGANGGLPTTNGTKLNQTVDLTAGQSIAVSGDVHLSDNSLGDVKTTIEAAGSSLASILEDTGTTLDTKINTIDTVVDLIEDIVRNQLEITDLNGNTVLRADNSTDALFTVAGLIVDNSTITTRKRLE